MDQREISKIKVDSTEYDIKDAELRRMLDILLGNAISIDSPESTCDDNTVAQQ